MLIVCPDALILWGKVLVVDALADYGVTHIEIPVSPERVWRARHDGGAPSTGNSRGNAVGIGVLFNDLDGL